MAQCAVIPTDEAAGLPLFHYVRGLIAKAGHQSIVADVTGSLHDIGLVVAFGAGCKRAADVDLGVWLSPDFADPDTADALVNAKGPGLIVGSLADAGWDRASAARLRQFEILHLARVDRYFELPGDPMGSIEVLTQILGRMSAMIGRV